MRLTNREPNLFEKREQINPMKMKLPSGKILSGSELERFKDETKAIYAKYLFTLYEWLGRCLFCFSWFFFIWFSHKRDWLNWIDIITIRCFIEIIDFGIIFFIVIFIFFEFLTPTAWCLKSCCYSQDEIPRKRFWSDEKLIKNMKRLIFIVFFIIERVFFKGIHRKNKKVKTLFASILIPKCVFLKTKM